jgi:hypothetical protein
MLTEMAVLLIVTNLVSVFFANRHGFQSGANLMYRYLKGKQMSLGEKIKLEDHMEKAVAQRAKYNEKKRKRLQSKEGGELPNA